jgi:hypothetical protein
MAFRHIETSLHRHYKFAFQDVQKADYGISGPLAYLKHHLSDFIQVVFFDVQVAEKEFVWPFDTLKHRFVDFTKVVI